MGADPASRSIQEAVVYLEQQIRALRDDHAKSQLTVDQLRRQVHDLFEVMDEQKRTVREVDSRFGPFKGIPEKIRALDEHAEHLRQNITANRSELENAIRLLQAESGYHREERADAIRRIEAVSAGLELVTADVAQLQAQVSNVAQITQTLLERQREVEARVEQFGLRLERSIEVHRDLELRVRDAILEDQEARFEVVHERLQVVGEMVRRNEEIIREATAEQTMREEVLQEIGVWRDQHNRLEGRLGGLEEAADAVLGQIDRLHASISLVEGRHTGLSERVAAIRRDIAEVVDSVREEFVKFNQMIEKQRRKQIQVLEQELREMKFHAFRPPDEP